MLTDEEAMELMAEDMVVDIPIKHESKPYLMIPFPDNATNGDVIKAIFKSRDLSIIQERLEHTHWWNAKYKAESEDEEDADID